MEEKETHPLGLCNSNCALDDFGTWISAMSDSSIADKGEALGKLSCKLPLLIIKQHSTFEYGLRLDRNAY